jgi:hypothetical protein
MPAIPSAVDLDEVERAVGATFYARGAEYVRQGRVLRMGWDDINDALHGSVIGKGDVYETSAYFSHRRGELEFDEGDCSCPVGFNCKHVAALVVAAASRPRKQPKARPRPRTWDERLDSLLAADPVATGTVPLGIELTLADGDDSAVRLLARLVKPGRSGWVGTGLTWGKLSTPQYMTGHIAEHVQLLREFYALHRSAGSRAGYHGVPYDEKSIDLASFESR